MSKDELRLAAYLLRIAADEFSNHGCNDMPDEAWEGISPASLLVMERRFNEYNGSTKPDDWMREPWIGDSSWMHFLADALKAEAEGRE